MQKVKVINSWGSETFYLEDIIHPKNKRNKTMLCEFDNGYVEELPVVWFEENRTVSDMGNRYDVVNKIPYVVITYNGSTFYKKITELNGIAFPDNKENVDE